MEVRFVVHLLLFPGFHDLGGPPVMLPLLLSCRASSTSDARRFTSAEMGLVDRKNINRTVKTVN